MKVVRYVHVGESLNLLQLVQAVALMLGDVQQEIRVHNTGNLLCPRQSYRLMMLVLGLPGAWRAARLEGSAPAVSCKVLSGATNLMVHMRSARPPSVFTCPFLLIALLKFHSKHLRYLVHHLEDFKMLTGGI
jgi:hypothetical protein